MDPKTAKEKAAQALSEHQLDELLVRKNGQKLYLTVSIKGVRSAVDLSRIVSEALDGTFAGAFVTSARGKAGEKDAQATFLLIQ